MLGEKTALRGCNWLVETIPLKECQRLVEAFHYSGGGSNTATYRHGLVNRATGEIMGCAWWIPPTKSAALATYPDNWQGVLNLSRLALDPRVPRNGASFLLAASRKLIDRALWPALVTYADEWRGHTGAIYRADNWQYAGKTKPEATFVLNGRMIARKAGPRTRTRAEMAALGAVCVGSFAKHKYTRIEY